MRYMCVFNSDGEWVQMLETYTEHTVDEEVPADVKNATLTPLVFEFGIRNHRKRRKMIKSIALSQINADCKYCVGNNMC